MTDAERKELILDLWLSVKVRHICRKLVNPPKIIDGIIIKQHEGYNLADDLAYERSLQKKQGTRNAQTNV